MPRVWINGKFFDKAEAKVSVYDHGLLYGDGVFEGIRVYHGKVFRLKQHDSASTTWAQSGPRDRTGLPVQSAQSGQ